MFNTSINKFTYINQNQVERFKNTERKKVMLYNAIKEFSKRISTTKAAESCGNDPIAKLFLALKKKGITVKVDPKDNLHIECGYKREAIIKRVEKCIKIEGEWENLDYVVLETKEYHLKFRTTLEGWVFCNTRKLGESSYVIHTTDDSELPKFLTC